MRRGRRARFAARAVKTIAIVAIAIDAVARAVASADDVDADAPLLSFGHYVKGETAASLIDPDVRAAAAIENELIIPGSVWAQALDEAARVKRKDAIELGATERVLKTDDAEATTTTRTDAGGDDRDGVDAPARHGDRFLAWLSRHGERAKRYCGEERLPCEESLRRERIFEANVAKVDAHNANVPPNGMRMRVGKFADLTEEEFEQRHVAYERRTHHKKRGVEVAALGVKPTKAKSAANQSKNPQSAEASTVEKSNVDANAKRAKVVRAKVVDNEAEKEKQTPSVKAPTDEADETRLGKKDGLDRRFVDFVARYGKQKTYCADQSYPCGEAFRRQTVFLKNLRDIEATNKRGGMIKRVTRFADLESDEFARDHATYANATVEDSNVVRLPKLGDLSAEDVAALHATRPHSRRSRISFSSSARHRRDDAFDAVGSLGKFEFTSQGFNESMDWRKKIDIGPIYSQGMCSGCWAFTTAQVVGDSKAIATGSRMAVSPYHLLSCDNLDSACNTGNMATAYAWINVQPKGVLVATDFPEGSSCEVVKSDQSRGVKIDGYCEIPPLEGESTLINLMRALQQQTVAVGVNIKPLQLYGGGIVRLHDCPPADSDPLLAINHAAVLVGWGYDQQSKQGYWIMKNSYDSDWGEDGYAKLSMELGEGGYGTCGLYTEQNYPLTDGRSCVAGSTKKWSVKRGDDVYLEPDDVLVLPNGKGLITPFKFEIFGLDLTSTLQLAAMFCFSLCFVLILIELYFCLFPELEGEQYDDELESGNEPSVGSSLLKAEQGGYGASEK